MDEFKRSVADALRYWEARRVFYNVVLTGVAVLWVKFTWPHFRPAQLLSVPPGDTHSALLILIILAVYGWHRYYLVYLYMSNRDKEPKDGLALDPLPVVTIQQPLYNEMYVADRLID